MSVWRQSTLVFYLLEHTNDNAELVTLLYFRSETEATFATACSPTRKLCLPDSCTKYICLQTLSIPSQASLSLYGLSDTEDFLLKTDSRTKQYALIEKYILEYLISVHITLYQILSKIQLLYICSMQTTYGISNI